MTLKCKIYDFIMTKLRLLGDEIKFFVYKISLFLGAQTELVCHLPS
jgi:hypothetical protein